MPKRTDLKSILIIGAGPIVIGQACEFDYSGAQACKALREEGFRVILVNSNPATIMTEDVYKRQEWGQHLSRIQKGLKDRDAAQLCMAAHTIKGLLAIFHGEAARRIALDLEHETKIVDRVDWIRCDRLAELLVLEIARLKPEMERFVRGEIPV